MTKTVPPDMPSGTCRIAFVAEAPGREEEDEGRPLVGQSGRLFDAVLQKAFRGTPLSRGGCYVGNVFRSRPPRNDVAAFFIGPGALARELAGVGISKTKAQAICRTRVGAPDSHAAFFEHPKHETLGWLRPEHSADVAALVADLEAVGPNVIVAMGGTPLWALTGYSSITSYRGAVLPSTRGPWKVVPTFHPAFILRQYSSMPYFRADLSKAIRQSAFPEIRRSLRIIKVPESFSEVVALFTELAKGTSLSYDIETDGRRILCISLSGDKGLAVVVPFEKDGKSYWSAEDERLVWTQLRVLLEDTPMPKVAHNSLYDMSYLSYYGIRPGKRSPTHDTQLLHHSLQPEMRKALGILGSLYLDEAPWKTMRSWAKNRVNKGDE